MATVKTLWCGALLYKKMMATGAAVIACAVANAATFERTIPAPNGVGDVVALTNALTELNTTYTDYRTVVRIWLKPGTYDLSGVYMMSSHHLLIGAYHGGILAGLGDGPEDTILLGGGEAEAHGVIYSNGGGNWECFTVSNLTVTGGWTTGNGGGICGTHTTAYRNLIVSNNYAKGSANGAGGGGCSKGCAYNCLFADNHCTDRWGGGFLVDGYSTRNDRIGQGAWNCVFVGNTAKEYGGGFAVVGGQCHNCSFSNNTASTGSGVYFYRVNYKTYSEKPRTSCVTNCTFTGNVGNGALYVYYDAAQRTVPVTNCVFRMNSGGRTVSGGDMNGCVVECNDSSGSCVVDSTMKDCSARWNRGGVSNCNMEDCLIEANTNGSAIVIDCNMTRCVLKNNVVTTRYAAGVDASSDVGGSTNVNCRIENNKYVALGSDSVYGAILKNKVLVNCTILDNDAANSNYGRPLDACALWNCVLSGNKLGSTRRDVRINYKSGGEYSMWLTNCVFAASDIPAGEIGADGAIAHDRFGNCRQITAAKMKFVDAANGNYTPTTRSPLYNTGLASDWILALVGEKDLAGNTRVFDKGIDIGAYECQLHRPGMMVIVQ